MDLHWARVLLFVVEFSSQGFGQHFVDSQVGQKQVVVLQQLPLIFKLSVVSLELVNTYNLRNARDLQVFNLVLECSLGVLDKHADSRRVLLTVEGVGHRDHAGSRSALGGDLAQSESHSDVLLVCVGKEDLASLSKRISLHLLEL